MNKKKEEKEENNENIIPDLVDSILGPEKEAGGKKEKKDKKPHIDVFQNFSPSLFDPKWKDTRHFRLGIVSDNHENSKYTQITHLHRFYDLAYGLGVRDFYHAGDIDEGERMRPGHQYDCYKQGLDDHVENICRLYPKKPGAKTYFITGNHDASMIKHCGANIGPKIAEKRKDMIYLGPDCVDVKLTDNCIMELRHPWDGTSYAISYKPQKMIDAIPSREKPKILIIGHYHKSEYLLYRDIHCFQAGTFCSQTPFMKGHAISCSMGGWILDFEVGSDGSILWMTSTFIPFYETIPEDYKHWLA